MAPATLTLYDCTREVMEMATCQSQSLWMPELKPSSSAPSTSTAFSKSGASQGGLLSGPMAVPKIQ